MLCCIKDCENLDGKDELKICCELDARFLFFFPVTAEFVYIQLLIIYFIWCYVWNSDIFCGWIHQLRIWT